MQNFALTLYKAFTSERTVISLNQSNPLIGYYFIKKVVGLYQPFVCYQIRTFLTFFTSF